MKKYKFSDKHLCDEKEYCEWHQIYLSSLMKSLGVACTYLSSKECGSISLSFF